MNRWSRLLSGVGAVALGAVAVVVPGTFSPLPTAAFGDSSPTFVQEGARTSTPGRAVRLGKFNDWSSSYSSLGGYQLYDTDTRFGAAVPTAPPEALDLMVAGQAMLRTDGSIGGFDARWSPTSQSQPFPKPPDEVTYTGLVNAGDSLVALRSDGALVGASSFAGTLPTSEATYAAVAAGAHVLAIREDGSLAAGVTMRCQDSFTAPEGMSYTAVSVGWDQSRGDHTETWMALRSDGAVITCLPGATEATITSATEGSRYVGVDAGAGYGLAAREDGHIETIGATSLRSVQPPDGRTVVALAAGKTTGAAVLDDGKIISWGAPLDVPDTPGGAGRFLYVGEDNGVFTAIWDHDLMDVSTRIVSAPTAIPLYDDVTIGVEVRGEDGFVPAGWLCALTGAPGSRKGCVPVSGAGTWSVTIPGDSSGYPMGLFDYTVAYLSPLSVPANDVGSVRMGDRTPVEVSATGPKTWSVGQAGIRFTIALSSANGEPMSKDTGRVMISTRCGAGSEYSSDTILGEGGISWQQPSTTVTIDTTLCGPVDKLPIYASYSHSGSGSWLGQMTMVGTVDIQARAAISVVEPQAALSSRTASSFYVMVDADEPCCGVADFASGAIEVRWKGAVVASAQLVDGAASVTVPAGLAVGTGMLEIRYAGGEDLGPATWSKSTTVN